MIPISAVPADFSADDRRLLDRVCAATAHVAHDVWATVERCAVELDAAPDAVDRVMQYFAVVRDWYVEHMRRN
jgi:hypothetical protein